MEVAAGFGNVGKEVGMNISKKKEDILLIKGSMKEADDVPGYMEDKMKKAIKHSKHQWRGC